MLLLGRRFVDEGLVDVRDDTSASDGGLDEGVEFFVPADGELQVTRGDALDLEVLGSVSGQFKDFGGQVLEDGSGVDSSGGADVLASGDAGLQETVDTSDGELQWIRSAKRNGEKVGEGVRWVQHI
jgi:hypothetical protein